MRELCLQSVSIPPNQYTNEINIYLHIKDNKHLQLSIKNSYLLSESNFRVTCKKNNKFKLDEN